MKAEQFDYVVKVNGYKGKGIEAARLVAVNGFTFSKASEKAGCNKSAAHAALLRVFAAHTRIYGE